jgi:hypothetical protein
MQTLRIYDFLPSKPIVVDPRVVLTLLGERAVRASWQVAAVARYNDAFMVTGDEAADRLEALSESQSRISGALLIQLIHEVVQVIWGEFRGYEEGKDAPWVVVRAIDSSWCEVETDDEKVLNAVRGTFVDVRAAPQG